MTREEAIEVLKNNDEYDRHYIGEVKDESQEAIGMAIKSIEAWDKVFVGYNNLVTNGETKEHSAYWRGVEDMWNIIRKEI